ncbi:MAG: hypothetical protein WAT70_07315 [Rhizobiaceae bacterium]
MRRIVLPALLLAAPALAGEADVIDVRYAQASDGSYAFDVTVRHADEGWDHYADRWEIVGPDGAVIAARVLLHPHVDEQPFTRSLAGIEIAEEVAEVTVRAHDSVHGYGGAEVTVAMRGSL